jgi:hypothetical protein
VDVTHHTLWHSIFYLCAHTYAHFNFVWMALGQVDIDEGMTLLSLKWTFTHIFSIFFAKKTSLQSCRLCHMSNLLSDPCLLVHFTFWWRRKEAWGHKKQCHWKLFYILFVHPSSFYEPSPSIPHPPPPLKEMKLNIYELGMRNDAVFANKIMQKVNICVHTSEWRL